VVKTVTASTHGFVARIDVQALADASARCSQAVEVVLHVAIGTFVAFEDPLAEVKAHNAQDAHMLGEVVERAVERVPQRDIAVDPLAAIEELENIAWTSISTAQSDPDPGLLAIYNLRDLLARWTEERLEEGVQAAPVVYSDDVLTRLVGAFASLSVSASESMQHQTCAAILRSLAVVYPRLSPTLCGQVRDCVARTLPALGDHVLTVELDRALREMRAALEEAGEVETANAVENARSALARSIGKLRSRATRSQ
jgi:hypothetical protein